MEGCRRRGQDLAALRIESRSSPSSPPQASLEPSALNAMERTWPGQPAAIGCRLPLARSQRIPDPCSSVLASTRPWAAIAIDRTGVPCPRVCPRGCPVALFHDRTIPSALPV